MHYPRSALFNAGVAVEATPTHIIPVHLGDPALCSALSNVLLQRYGHSVRAIKLPTVLRGQEKFMLAHMPQYFQ